MPESLTTQHLFPNIPAQNLHLYHQENLMLAEKKIFSVVCRCMYLWNHNVLHTSFAAFGNLSICVILTGIYRKNLYSDYAKMST